MFKRMKPETKFFERLAASRLRWLFELDHSGASLLKSGLAEAIEGGRPEEPDQQCDAFLRIVGQHRDGVAMSFNFPNDLNAIGEAYVETFHRQVALVKLSPLYNPRLHKTRSWQPTALRKWKYFNATFDQGQRDFRTLDQSNRESIT